jgi:DNA polymerase-3 subunit beta
MSEPSRAALVLPSENEEDEDLLMLIMPVMIAQ